MSPSPRGYYWFYGRRYRLNWAGIEHLLGKVPDGDVARRLGASVYAVRRMRRVLGVRRFRMTERVRRLLGRHPDGVVARMTGASRMTVWRTRRDEGIPPCPRYRRQDYIRVRRARNVAEQKERVHGPDHGVL